VELKDARGADASIPHLQSDHLSVFLYQTVVPVAGVDVKLVLPESEDLVVDMYAALGRPDDDPHWATLWQGSVALAEEVLENPSLVRGKRVLDLGTGLGLAGLAAGLAGAKEVVLTDREPRALYCALCAAAANGLSVVPTQSGGLDDPVFGKDAPGLDGVPLPEVLSFKQSAGEDNTRDDVCVVSAALLDWFKPDCDQFGDGGFDVVLACDVLYTPSAVDVIAPLVLRLFGKEKRPGERNKSTNNVFVLADPPGRFPENHERFLRLMEDPDRFADDASGEENDDKNRPALRARLMDGTGKSRECVNLEGEAMTVDLSTYVIEG
jgi:predicted nicotinamide N-methyase